MASKRRSNHGGGQLYPDVVIERPRFVISVRQVEREGRANLKVHDRHVAEVLDTESGLVVHTTGPQADAMDAKVIAGLWVDEQLRIADCGLRIEKKRPA